jgi:hypothetical protein
MHVQLGFVKDGKRGRVAPHVHKGSHAQVGPRDRVAHQPLAPIIFEALVIVSDKGRYQIQLVLDRFDIRSRYCNGPYDTIISKRPLV